MSYEKLKTTKTEDVRRYIVTTFLVDQYKETSQRIETDTTIEGFADFWMTGIDDIIEIEFKYLEDGKVGRIKIEKFFG